MIRAGIDRAKAVEREKALESVQLSNKDEAPPHLIGTFNRRTSPSLGKVLKNNFQQKSRIINRKLFKSSHDLKVRILKIESLPYFLHGFSVHFIGYYSKILYLEILAQICCYTMQSLQSTATPRILLKVS